MFEGSTVALATPHRKGQVDYDALADLVEFQIAGGTDVLLPCGCTGEAATLSHEEQIEVIRFVIQRVKKRVPVMAGTGSNNTKEALALTLAAKEAGADGALLITPYYNKPTQDGLVAHYTTIAEAAKMPIILYNVPGRTGTNIMPETVAKLAKVSNIVAIKEASGNVDQVSQIVSSCKMMVLSGDDSLTLPMMVIGAKGVVSVAANVIPKDVADMVRLANKGQWAQAKDLHYKMMPIFKAMFIETNPLPVKTSLALMKKIQKEFRLPLCAMQAGNEEKLKQVLVGYGLCS